MKNILYRTLVLLAAVFTMGACEENELPEVTQPYDPSTEAKVKFFYHVQGAPAAAFYLNDTKLTAIAPTTTGLAAGLHRGQLFGTVFPNNNYAEVPAGTFKLRVIDIDSTMKVTDSTMVPTSKFVEMASKEVKLEPNTFYSAYFVGTPPIKAKPATATTPAVPAVPATYEIHLAKDNQPAPDYDKTWWRFINTMAGAPAGFKVDAYAVKPKVPVSATNPVEVPAVIIPLGKDLAFKEQGDYVQLPVLGSYTFKVFVSGTTYDPETSTPFLSHTRAITNSDKGRVFTTQIRGTYSASPGTTNRDFWRER